MPTVVLVPGYGGRLRAVERWRVAVGMATLAANGGGRLVVSGHGGEAERMAALVPSGVDVIVESSARSTFENVERSLAFLEDATRVAVASDRLHVRRATSYLRQLRPDLAARLVTSTRPSPWSGWWMDAGSAVHELVVGAQRLRAVLGRKSVA